MRQSTKFGNRIDISRLGLQESSMSEEDFNKAYPLDKFEVYTDSDIDMFVKAIHKEVGEIIVKAFPDGLKEDSKCPEGDAIIEKGRKDISKLQKKTITTKNGITKTVYVRPAEPSARDAMKKQVSDQFTDKKVADADKHIHDADKIFSSVHEKLQDEGYLFSGGDRNKLVNLIKEHKGDEGKILTAARKEFADNKEEKRNL